jgi:ABC-type multidrug transport system ATPase subunit
MKNTSPNGVTQNKIHPNENEVEKIPTIQLDIPDVKEITLTWENIDVHLPPDGFCAKLPCMKIESKKTHILNNASGIAKPGKLLAIMGASGSGKTTLLNCLNFRNRGSLKITGRVKINGSEINSSRALQAISGYIQQEDLFIGTLKVKEHLKFQAMLRMDSNFTNEQKMSRVEEILNELNLKKCEDALIGIPEKNIKGISGGEKRRLAFASEVITNPSLLFADEPTSGRSHDFKYKNLSF